MFKTSNTFYFSLAAMSFLVAAPVAANDDFVGKWAKCSLDCIDDDIECWTSEMLELEWFTSSGKSIFLRGPALRDTPRETSATMQDMSPEFEEFAKHFGMISEMSIFVEIGGVTIEGPQITYTYIGDQEPFAAVLGPVGQDDYSYTFANQDGSTTTVDMCRVDEFSPLFEGLANYLLSRNTLDPTVSRLVLSGTPQDSGKPSDSFWHPMSFRSDDKDFFVFVDNVKGGDEPVSSPIGNIFQISPEVTVVLSVSNSEAINDLLRSSFAR